MIPSILALEFDLILSLCGPNGLILGFGQGLKTAFESTHVVKQLLFSIVPSIVTFDFSLI